MALQECPRCRAKVQPTDTLCMDCGADLVAEQRRAERMLFETARLPVAAAAPPPSAAATGRADMGESSEATRLRIFDQQLAQALVSERLTAYVTAAIALIICVAAGSAASHQIESAGGLSGLKTVTPAGIRQLGWSAFTDSAVTGMWMALTTTSAFLCFVGQTWRGIVAGKCIRAVHAGQKPVVVGISMTTRGGLILFSLICPPAGIVLGLVLKLRPDEETAAFGGTLMWVGFIALLALMINWLWGLAEQLKTKARPERTAPGAGLWVHPLCVAALSAVHARRPVDQGQ